MKLDAGLYFRTQHLTLYLFSEEGSSSCLAALNLKPYFVELFDPLEMH